MSSSYAQWCIPEIVSLEDVTPGYPIIRITNAFATASIALHGGHVMFYQAKGQLPLLWLSRDAIYKQGKAIRGGIPICWPWFGNSINNPELPAHGFARNQFWEITSIKNNPAQGTFVTLTLSDSMESLSVWPYKFKLTLTIVVGAQLRVELCVTNCDQQSFDFTCALHSYLSISDIENIVIHGLENSPYIDKLQNDVQGSDSGGIRFNQEIDRVYQQTQSEVLVVDGGDVDGNRTITVSKFGSFSTVVWNPWIDKSSAMSDFHHQGYKNMVCVEPAITTDNAVSLKSGQSHLISTSLTSI